MKKYETMIYQFEYEEIEYCSECPINNCTVDYCTLSGKYTYKSTPKENNCPLVVSSEKETTSCEWCNGKEYTIDCRDYTCLEITGNKLTAWGEGEATGHINYCPNCGRKLKGE